MTEHLTIDSNILAYDLIGDGPLVVLAHGMGDSRHSYRFVAPQLVAAGYRVANVDIRGCGESSPDWDGYSRTDIAGDLVALVRHLGGPAVIVGQSISGGAATIAAATAPDVITGIIELAPFTRKQSISFGGLLTNKRYRAGSAGADAHRDHRQGHQLVLVPRPGHAHEAERLGRRARAHRDHAGRPGPHEGTPGHVQDHPRRRRRPAGPRRLPRPGGAGESRPRLGRPARRRRQDHRRPARRTGSSSSSTAWATTPTPRLPTRSLPSRCRSWPGPCPVPRAGLTAAAVTEAGAALADEVGLDRLSMGLLAERLGVKTPSLYKHVDSLADLTHRIGVLAMVELGDAVRDATQGRADADALIAAARAMRAFVKERPGRYDAGDRARTTGPDDPLVAAADASWPASLPCCAATDARARRRDPRTQGVRSVLHGFTTVEASAGS